MLVGVKKCTVFSPKSSKNMDCAFKRPKRYKHCTLKICPLYSLKVFDNINYVLKNKKIPYCTLKCHKNYALHSKNSKNSSFTSHKRKNKKISKVPKKISIALSKVIQKYVT